MTVLDKDHAFCRLQEVFDYILHHCSSSVVGKQGTINGVRPSATLGHENQKETPMKSEQFSLTKTNNERGEVKQRERRSAALVGGSCRAIGVTCVALAALLGATPARASETVLHSFVPYPLGANLLANVCLGPGNNIYGTASGGGPTGNGVVFRVDNAGHGAVLHSFTGSNDGGSP